MLCILFLTGSGTAFSVSYPKEFGDDWTSAVQFIDAHHTAWKPLFEEFGVDARLAEAIVFPELIRYSRWQDEIETAAVNGLYVLQGTSGANFSIGRFQMKPSFAEEVEAAWNQSALAKEYGIAISRSGRHVGHHLQPLFFDDLGASLPAAPSEEFPY